MITMQDAIGLTGVALSIYCYGRVQWQRDFAKRIDYSLLNLAACGLIFIALAQNGSVTGFASNVAWTLISLYGVYRCLKYRRRARLADMA